MSNDLNPYQPPPDNKCSMFPRNMGIDHCIIELVERINEAGLETDASCCGHGFQPTRISLKNGAEILVLNFEQAQRVAKLFPDINGMTRHRGHAIRPTGFIYEDTGEPVSDNPDRACGYCDLANTPEGHDGCLGTLPGVMNACCGHGNPDEASIQYDNGDRIGGVDALYAALQMKADSTPPRRPTATGGITEADIDWIEEWLDENADRPLPKEVRQLREHLDYMRRALIERAGEEGE